jgi:hypothetical protein
MTIDKGMKVPTKPEDCPFWNRVVEKGAVIIDYSCEDGGCNIEGSAACCLICPKYEKCEDTCDELSRTHCGHF